MSLDEQLTLANEWIEMKRKQITDRMADNAGEICEWRGEEIKLYISEAFVANGLPARRARDYRNTISITTL